MKSAKCRPPKSSYYKSDFKPCTATNSFDPLFMENVNDIADTMSEIMIVFGIHRCKAKLTRPIIVQAFQFYDTQRHQFRNLERCGICRSDIVAEFEHQCLMNRVEALLAYCIIKRAMKAFYHGTPDFSIKSPVHEAVLLKQQQFIWQHAAIRTILMFEREKHMFFNAQSNYAQQIIKIYNELYNRLKSRADPVIVEDHHPRGCVKKIITGTQSPPKLDSENKRECVKKCQTYGSLKDYIKSLPIKTFPVKSCLTLSSPCSPACNSSMPPHHSSETAKPKRKKERKNIDLNLPRCYKCNCPKIICDCEVESNSGVFAVDCGQGPFECQWVRMNKREKSDPYIEKRDRHQCPVDCSTSESSSESDVCTCTGDSSSEENTNSEVVSAEEEFAKSDNEESLNRLMPKDLPKIRKNYSYQIRTISKLPPNQTRATLNPMKKKEKL